MPRASLRQMSRWSESKEKLFKTLPDAVLEETPEGEEVVPLGGGAQKEQRVGWVPERSS